MREMGGLVRAILPKSLLLGIWARREIRDGEPALRLLPALLGDGGTFVDIGGNLGLYSSHACRYASDVHIFEPNPDLSEKLRSAFGDRARVHEIALSDQAGRVTFRIPRRNRRDLHRRGSIEPCDAAEFDEVRTLEVNRRPLDDFAFPEIAAIKIDVAGHELSVLRGAEGTLSRLSPAIIVEVEEFRQPGRFARIRGFLRDRGYDGFQVLRDELRPLGALAPERDPRRMTNFLFAHPRRKYGLAAGS